MTGQSGPDEHANSEAKRERKPIFQDLLGSGIHRKIILPYVILTIMVAAIGMAIVTRQVADSLEERFIRQLFETLRVAGDGLVRQEARQLEDLRPMTQTTGVAEAIQDADINRLRELLEVQAYNRNLDSVLVMDQSGNLVLRLDAVRNFHQDVIDEYQFSSGGNYAQEPIIARVLAGDSDALGDKFAGIVETPAGPVLYTSAPVYRFEDDEIAELAGVILVGNRLERILVRLKQEEALADITIYTASPTPISSTLPNWDHQEQLDVLSIDQDLFKNVLFDPENIPIQTLSLYGREYRFAYTSLVLRGQPVGVISVALSGGFVLNSIFDNQFILLIIFVVTVGMMAVVGYWISRRISKPITKLAGVTRAIAGGDLEVRADTFTRDEVGDLTRDFNEMADKLQITLAELEAILASIADGVVVRDPKGDYIEKRINPAARDLLKDHSGEIDYHLLDDFTEPTDSDEAFPRFDVAGRTLSISVAQVNTKDGQYLGDVLVLHDVTSETIGQRTKDSFLNAIGHEFRTPLTSIRANADVLRMALQKDKLSTEQRIERLDSIFEETEKLSEMVNDVIGLADLEQELEALRRDIASQEPDQQASRHEKVDLEKLVRRALDEQQPGFEKSQIVPQFEYDGSSVYVLADARRLRQAIGALLKNARLYSPEGGPLKVLLQVQDGKAIVRITDPGVGVSEDDRSKIFDQFYRGEPTDAEGNLIDVRGLGQGLYFVKSVLKLHDGSAELEKTQLGEGSTFSITLPLTPTTDDEGS